MENIFLPLFASNIYLIYLGLNIFEFIPNKKMVKYAGLCFKIYFEELNKKEKLNK